MRNRAYSQSEYKIEDLYPSRVQWHVRSTLQGLYGAVIQDLRALPISESGAVERLEQTHNFLCQYYADGVQDPQREVILRQIGREVMQIITKNAAYLEAEEQPWNTRLTTIRLLREAKQLLDNALLELLTQLQGSEPYSREFFDLLDSLFGVIWTTLSLNDEQQRAIEQIVFAEQANPLVAQTIVGSLFLGTMEYFDSRKVELLLYAYEEYPNAQTQGAALSALLILGRRHQEVLLKLEPELTDRISKAIQRDESQLLETIKTIHTAYKTSENHQIYVDKILPEIKGLSDKLQQVMGNTLAERIDQMQNIDPDKLEEVERLMADAPEKFSIMKDKDQDIAYHMVTELKAFPFFQKISHWFMPYDSRYPGIDRDNAKALERIAPMLYQGKPLISSDMYSYAFVNTWQQVAGAVEAQMQGMDIPDTASKATTVLDGVRDFVFGAYRFYQLSSAAHSLINPFTLSPYVLGGAFLNEIGAISEEGLLKMANLMVRYGQYGAAGLTYERIVADYMTDSAEVWRGMAVASLMRGEDERALEQLQKAVECEGKTSITIKKIAELLVKLGRKQEAIKWLEESEQEIPEEGYPPAFMRAKLMFEMGQIEGSLEPAYKAAYLADNKDADVVALLIRILLALDRTDEAMSQLESVAKENDLSGELLQLSGIIEIAQGNRKEGIKKLQKWVQSGSEGTSLSDSLTLLSHYGIEPWEQALIQDVINQQINKEL